jgi:hypothetical protein
MDHIFLGEFAYPGINEAYPGRCGLSVWRDSTKYYAVVVASELPTNPGTSITNAYERLATQVVRRLWPQVPPWGTLWFEHYPPGLGIAAAHTYDLVTFGLVKQTDTGMVVYAHPSWRPVSRRFVAEAIGVPSGAWLQPWDQEPEDPAARAFDPDLMNTAPAAISGMDAAN